MESQIAQLDRQTRQLVESDDDMNHKDGLLPSVPGVGKVASATLLSELTGLGDLDRKQAASLVGVAPFNRDPGTRRGQRAVCDGRTSVRSVLYRATLAAIRFNPVIRVSAQRLRNAAKPAKVVITAGLRKRLTILNAKLRENLSWHELNLVKNLKQP